MPATPDMEGEKRASAAGEGHSGGTRALRSSTRRTGNRAWAVPARVRRRRPSASGRRVRLHVHGREVRLRPVGSDRPADAGDHLCPPPPGDRRRRRPHRARRRKDPDRHQWRRTGRRARRRCSGLADRAPDAEPVHVFLPEERAQVVGVSEAWSEIDHSHRKLARRGGQRGWDEKVLVSGLVPKPEEIREISVSLATHLAAARPPRRTRAACRAHGAGCGPPPR